MKTLAAVCAAVCALAVAGAAGAHTTTATAGGTGMTFGVADDTGKYADDGGAWFDQELQGASLGEVRWTLRYSGSSTQIAELPFLQRAAPQAQKDGVKVELALYGGTDDGNTRPADFCAWAAYVAQTVQPWGIQDFIIWNEPNTGLYWRGAGTDSTVPAKYEALLASCYDTIKAANPSAVVIGFGLSPRKGTASQMSPLQFIRDAGAAYKASGRTTPIMDLISVHPYPNPNNPTDGPDVGYADTTAYGIPNLDRVKQAVYDAFDGTGQPTTVNGLRIVLDEVGWQTDTTAYPQYIHGENVSVVSEAQQVQYLQVATQKYFACDPTIATVNWFLLVDEATRDGKDASNTTVGGGWQSGLVTAGGQGVSTHKAAYAALAPIWALGSAACTGAQIAWRPAGGSSSGGGQGSFEQLFGTLQLQELFPDVSGNITQIKGLFATLPVVFGTTASVGSIFGPANQFFVQFQQLMGDLGARIQAAFALFHTAGGSLDDASVLAGLGPQARHLTRATAKVTVLAKTSKTVGAGKRLTVKLRAPKSKAKLKAGSVFAVVVLRGAGSSAKPMVFTKKLAVVKAKKPTKKKGKK